LVKISIENYALRYEFLSFGSVLQNQLLSIIVKIIKMMDGGWKYAGTIEERGI
jgi:hypothetical protein